MKHLIITVTVLIAQWCNGQDLSKGFTLLENGRFSEAKSYFQQKNDSFPENRTISLCYARAVGLSGEPEVAKAMFENLIERFPQDFEIKINLAESLLWNKEFEKALVAYEALLVENPNSFPSHLGYANSLSNLGQYDLALQAIHRTLDINFNENARISLKYIRLGKINELVKKGNFHVADSLINKNLVDFPEDQPTLLTKAYSLLARKNPKSAHKIFQNLKDTLQSGLGMTLTYHDMGMNGKALNQAKLLKDLNLHTSEAEEEAIQVRLAETYIWSKKFKKALIQMERLDSLYPKNRNHLWSMYHIYKGDFKNATPYFEAMIAKDSTSIEGIMGIANINRGRGDLRQAISYIKKALQVAPENKDIRNTYSELMKVLEPEISPMFKYSQDNGRNISRSLHNTFSFPMDFRNSLRMEYGYREAENTIQGFQTKSNNLELKYQHRFNGPIVVSAAVGVQKVQSQNAEFSILKGSVNMEAHPFPGHMAQLGIVRNLQDYNAELLSSKLVQHTLISAYNWNIGQGLGFYTNAQLTSISDDNLQISVFSSLYHSFPKRIGIKLGTNFQYLTFKDQRPQLYFSPESYNAFEVFNEYQKKFKTWDIHALAAWGSQSTKAISKNSLFRFEVKSSAKLSSNFQTFVYGKYSNNAAETVAGYQFYECGVGLRYNFKGRGQDQERLTVN